MENEKKPESSRRRMVRKVNLGQDKIKLDLSNTGWYWKEAERKALSR